MSPKEPEDHFVVKERARKRFLERLAELAPCVLAKLEKDVLPLFREVNGRPTNALSPLNKALKDWCLRFNLDAPWIRDVVLNTLATWTEQPTLRRNHFVNILWGGWDRQITLEFVFRHPGWDPTRLTWEQWKGGAEAVAVEVVDEEGELVEIPPEEAVEGVVQAFTRTLEEHKESTKAILEKSGNPMLLSTRRTEHFDWLVYFQAMEMSPRQIAEKLPGKPVYGSSDNQRRSIDKALKATAALIDLPLRERKPGRPRKR